MIKVTARQTPQFLERTSFGVCLNSVAQRKVFSRHRNPPVIEPRRSRKPVGTETLARMRTPSGKIPRSPTRDDRRRELSPEGDGGEPGGPYTVGAHVVSLFQCISRIAAGN